MSLLKLRLYISVLVLFILSVVSLQLKCIMHCDLQSAEDDGDTSDVLTEYRYFSSLLSFVAKFNNEL